MSIKNIAGALESRLAALTPTLPTAYENVPFTPTVGQAYQAVHLLVNKPLGMSISGADSQERGIFQITLNYPQGTGRGAAQDRAELVKQHFKPYQALTSGAAKVEIIDPVHVAQGRADGEYWSIPISVYWRAIES